MIRPVTVAAVVLAVSGLALAEPKDGGKPAKPDQKETAPKEVAPKKDEGKKDSRKKEAGEPTLKVGSKAPSIQVDKWLKGNEVKSFEPGKVYVVEFWATWCPPCIKSIPKLTELQKKHKSEGLTVIGVTSSEMKDKDGTDNREKKAQAFVNKQGDNMDYTVAYDGARAMGKSWLQAAGRTGIPSAFVVDGTGTVTWIGNPLSNHAEMEAAVTKALNAAKAGHAEARPAPAPKKAPIFVRA